MSAAMRNGVCGLVLAVAFGMGAGEANAGYRQYYSSWSYQPSTSYYYTTYYYKPQVSYSGYQYHYCIYYPSQPRYVYYYNPTRSNTGAATTSRARTGPCTRCSKTRTARRN